MQSTTCPRDRAIEPLSQRATEPQESSKANSSSEIEAFVNRLLSSFNLSDFLSQTVDRLQQQYVNSKEAHKAALALINEKLCYMVVRTFSRVIPGLDRP